MKKQKTTIITVIFTALAVIALLSACGNLDDQVSPGTETKTPVSIAVATLPAKIMYNLGDTALDTTGMVVTATYSDGFTENVTRYTTEGFDTSGVHHVTIIVKYFGKTAGFTINVVDPRHPTVAMPMASSAVGEAAAGATITLSTSTEGADIWYTTNGSDPVVNGTSSTKYTSPFAIRLPATVRAFAVKAGMNDSNMLIAAYTLHEEKTLVGIAVTTPPAKTTYNLGDTALDTAGMVVTATYSDATTGVVAAGYTTSGFNTQAAHRVTITVSYQGKVAGFSINVIDPGRQTVAKPVANPGSQSITAGEQREIELFCDTDGADIWYATNGSEPEENGAGSTKYTGPFSITAPLTVKAFAVKDGMNDSDVTVEEYTVYDPLPSSSSVPADFENDLWLQHAFREMRVGDTAEIYPRRVPEAVATATIAWGVDPPFYYEIIDGAGVVSITPETPTESNRTATVTALSQGVAIVKVTYGGFEMAQTAPSVYGTGPVSPINAAYAAFNVTSAASSITINPGNKIRGNQDMRFPYDTVYFTGDSVNWPITPTAIPGTITEVAAYNPATRVYVPVPAGAGGVYNLPLQNRQNIIRITASDGSLYYEMISARKIEIIVNPPNPRAGGSATVTFRGISNPVHKLAGIYNPQATGVQYTRTGIGGVDTISGASTQWDISRTNRLTLTRAQPGTETFTGGVIGQRWWGHPLGYDKNNKSTGTGFSGIAPVYGDSFSVLPDFSVTFR